MSYASPLLKCEVNIHLSRYSSVLYYSDWFNIMKIGLYNIVQYLLKIVYTCCLVNLIVLNCYHKLSIGVGNLLKCKCTIHARSLSYLVYFGDFMCEGCFLKMILFWMSLNELKKLNYEN